MRVSSRLGNNQSSINMARTYTEGTGLQNRVCPLPFAGSPSGMGAWNLTGLSISLPLGPHCSHMANSIFNITPWSTNLDIWTLKVQAKGMRSLALSVPVHRLWINLGTQPLCQTPWVPTSALSLTSRVIKSKLMFLLRFFICKIGIINILISEVCYEE